MNAIRNMKSTPQPSKK